MSLVQRLRRTLIGRPLPTARAQHERLSKIVALPVFSSDALSSVAYASDEILIALFVAGTFATRHYALYIAIAIASLLWILTISYRQTVMAYPSGGGAYIVARENLGSVPAQTAGAALLLDYILTVSVSVAAGVAAITSAFPHLAAHRTTLCVIAIALITVANLRGVRESGAIFAPPVYLFILTLLTLIAVGLYHYAQSLHTGVPLSAAYRPPVGVQPPAVLAPISIILLLHAFASGCSALTGVEAISNGVQAFRPPESRNAAATMLWMSLALGILFLGVTFLAQVIGVMPQANGETVISQIARTVMGGRNWFYFLVQSTTAVILVLAANTSFADFPRLSAILGIDGFVPRMFAGLGDRLVYANGIIALGVISSILVVIFRGDTHLLIPLYAVGVFVSFTLSQSGMVRRWFRLRTRAWARSAIINGIGAVTTLLVLTIIGWAKFVHGAWIVVVMIPLLVALFSGIHRHYRNVAAQLRLRPATPVPTAATQTVIVLVPGMHQGILPALSYARGIGDDVRGLYIEINPANTPRVREEWERWAMGVPLVILESPYRSLVEPVLAYINEAKFERPNHVVTVIIPEFVPRTLWGTALHNQSGLILKLALARQRDIVVANVRYYLER